VVDAAGQWEHARATLFVVAEFYKIRLIYGVEFDYRFGLVGIWKSRSHWRMLGLGTGVADMSLCFDRDVGIMVEIEIGLVLLGRQTIKLLGEVFNIDGGQTMFWRYRRCDHQRGFCKYTSSARDTVGCEKAIAFVVGDDEFEKGAYGSN
jgi:hypothetical protein